MTPLVPETAEGFDGEVRFTPMDVAEEFSRASDYKVMAVPTIVAVSQGREIGRAVGAQTPGTRQASSLGVGEHCVFFNSRRF